MAIIKNRIKLVVDIYIFRLSIKVKRNTPVFNGYKKVPIKPKGAYFTS